MDKRNLITAVLVASFLGLTACGSTVEKTEVSTTTKGQELIDLKKAFEAGTMTEKEYERQRQDILKK